ncbi:YdeI/OmpD-associated family protein [Streptomyces albiaxialis]
MTRTPTPAPAPAGQPELPTLPFASRAEWEAWLEERHGEADGVWIKLAKKGTGVTSVSYAEAVEVALCFGWIDGQSRRLDETYWLQKFTPRRSRSKWSQINRERATELIERGLMRPAGLREIERAKADGRWEAAYASPSQASVPDDLQAALDANEAARAFFATLDGRNRYAILHRIHDAKRPETRARRIEQFVTMLGEGRTPH